VIAVIDDDPGVLQATARLLNAAGFLTRTFASAEAFLQARTDTAVVCVVTDLIMPGLSGFDLKSELAKSDPQLPVILHTAAADPEVRVRAEQDGFVACLAKTDDASQLLCCIRGAVRVG
jgi:FixJ family two-component response regulator